MDGQTPLPPQTVEEIADLLTVSPRTILRSFSGLKAAGKPVVHIGFGPGRGKPKLYDPQEVIAALSRVASRLPRIDDRSQWSASPAEKLRSPLKWHGGKHYLADWIISHFPPHRKYVESFGGGASVLIQKPPSKFEVYNDLNEKVTRFFRVLRNDLHALKRKLRLTPYSEAEFNSASACPDDADDVEKARCDYVLWCQSFGGQGKSFSASIDRSRGGRADNVNAWKNKIESLDQVAARVADVQVLTRSAIEVIELFDGPDTLFYLDPPYVHHTRVSTNVYAHEMTDADHVALAKVLNRCQGKIILSGYRSPLYDRLYKNWRREEREIANHSAGGDKKTRQTECLWIS